MDGSEGVAGLVATNSQFSQLTHCLCKARRLTQKPAIHCECVPPHSHHLRFAIPGWRYTIDRAKRHRPPDPSDTRSSASSMHCHR
jgi:hypothetical protein